MSTTRRAARETYFRSPETQTQGMSASLRRARAPFFLRNTITGLVLISFAATVYTYSIAAVKQEEFSDADVKFLEEQVARRATNANSGSLTAAPTAQDKKVQGIVDMESSLLGAGPGSRRDDPVHESEIRQKLTRSSTQDGGAYVSQTLGSVIFRGKHAPSFLGAPSVDRPSRIGDRTSRDPIAFKI